jgi:hypothetical protein
VSQSGRRIVGRCPLKRKLLWLVVLTTTTTTTTTIQQLQQRQQHPTRTPHCVL